MATVALWCQVCDAEAEGEAPDSERHDVSKYSVPDPWRVVEVPSARGYAYRFLACSSACEEKIRRGGR